MTITIDRDVFDAAKNYDKMRDDAALAGLKIEDTIKALMNAANTTYGESDSGFHIVAITMPENAQTEKDFMLIFQQYDEEGQIMKSDAIDLSFAVNNDSHGFIHPAAIMRKNSTLQPDPQTGVPILQRSPMIDDVIHADDMGRLANKIFTWMLVKLPEDQQDMFQDNCERAGLIEQKTSIGFGRDIGLNPPPTALPAPSPEETLH